MLDRDVFVGGVAVIFGLVVVSAAVFNWQWYYELRKARWVESRWGRGGARLFFAVVGTALILLGSAIAAGWTVAHRRTGDLNESLRRRKENPKTTYNETVWGRAAKPVQPETI